MSGVIIEETTDEYIGKIVKDKVTGYEGVCVYRVDWLFGCRQYAVIEDGKPTKSVIFDVGRLAITGVKPELQDAELEAADTGVLGKHIKSKSSGIEGKCIGTVCKIYSNPLVILEQTVEEWNEDKDHVYWLDAGEVEIIDDNEDVDPEEVQDAHYHGGMLPDNYYEDC